MWLKNDLYDFADAKFNELSFNNLFNKSVLKKLLDDHKNGLADHGPLLWKTLVLISWLELYKNKVII